MMYYKYEIEKDTILRAVLLSDKSVTELEKLISLDIDSLSELLQELILIDYINPVSANGGGTFEITPKGKRFIEKTSFKEQSDIDYQAHKKEFDEKQAIKDRAETEFKWKGRDEIRKNITLGIAVAGLSLSIYNTINQSASATKILRIMDTIDIIKERVYESKLMIDSLKKTTKNSSTKNDIADTSKKQ